MEFTNYIIENRLILIPVLYIIGTIIKNTQIIKNKYIPFILLIIAIILSIFMGDISIINSIIQGILVAGTTVFSNQLIKQLRKEE
ncbi:MAG: phage holin family protein [Bacilli bacterium]